MSVPDLGAQAYRTLEQDQTRAPPVMQARLKHNKRSAAPEEMVGLHKICE